MTFAPQGTRTWRCYTSAPRARSPFLRDRNRCSGARNCATSHDPAFVREPLRSSTCGRKLWKHLVRCWDIALSPMQPGLLLTDVPAWHYASAPRRGWWIVLRPDGPSCRGKFSQSAAVDKAVDNCVDSRADACGM